MKSLESLKALVAAYKGHQDTIAAFGKFNQMAANFAKSDAQALIDRVERYEAAIQDAIDALEYDITGGKEVIIDLQAALSEKEGE